MKINFVVKTGFFFFSFVILMKAKLFEKYATGNGTAEEWNGREDQKMFFSQKLFWYFLVLLSFLTSYFQKKKKKRFI